MDLRIDISTSLSAFASWLVNHPVVGDPTYSRQSVRYQVARYCDYLDSNPWSGTDPLGDHAARDGAVSAYLQYLETFGVPAAMVASILVSVDCFYGFLGLGPARLEPLVRLG
jgi:hypothetical protein